MTLLLWVVDRLEEVGIAPGPADVFGRTAPCGLDDDQLVVLRHYVEDRRADHKPTVGWAVRPHGMFAGGAFSSRTAVPQKSGNPPLSGVHSLWIAFASLRPLRSVIWRWSFSPL